MSDIPDWLVELAAQGSDDDQETEAPDDDAFDFGSSDTLAYAPESEPTAAAFEVTPAVSAPEFAEQGTEPDGDLMTALRSQVEADVLEDAFEPVAPKRRINLKLPGLAAWQQLVLAVLLLLDVIVIGLLFLVMLGRIAIG